MKKVINVLIFISILLMIIYIIQKDDVKIVNNNEEVKQIIISIGNRDLIVNLENNSSALELYKKLKDNHITIDAHDYGNFEKVGDLGFSLPTNDEYITTKSGDLILYQGNKITLYYDTNSYSFTKLGHVINIDGMDLKDFLGSGSVKMTLSRK